MKLRNLRFDANFHKIKSIATILASLGLPISKDDIVNIALDGLPERYEHVSDIIIHREPFSDGSFYAYYGENAVEIADSTY
ncbi:hypothetical protein Tco_0749384 [Tanacetum coccineum]|uniref:Uncharacterized protein n=1 Tax=Tanacetum coccineum TaxID=301880 RepID=A0ABQ4YY82_9ASTR